MDATSQTVQIHRLSVGASYNRRICIPNYNTVTSLQQPITRPNDQRGGPTITAKLGLLQQRCEPPSWSVGQGASGGKSTKGLGHCCCSQMVWPALVPRSAGDVGGATIQDSAGKRHNESAWVMLQNQEIFKYLPRRYLQIPTLQIRALEHFLMHWARSKLDQYNHYVNGYFEYCVSQNIEFPSKTEDALSSFLCTVGCSTARPKSVLHGTLAASSVQWPPHNPWRVDYYRSWWMELLRHVL